MNLYTKIFLFFGIYICCLYGQNGDFQVKDLMKRAQQFSKQKKYPQAISCLRQVLSIYEQQASKDKKYEFERGCLLVKIGGCYELGEKYLAAIKYYKRALVIFEVGNISNRQQYLVQIYEKLGFLLDEQSQYAQAISYFKKQLRILRENNAQHEMARAYTNIATISKKQQYYGQASKYYEEALSILADMKVFNEWGKCLHSFANLLYAQGFYEEALRKYEQVYVLYDKAKNVEQLEIAMLLEDHGVTLVKLGKYDEALARQKKSFAIYKELQNQQGIARCISNTGDIYYSWGKYNLAEQKYKQALKICKENNDGKSHGAALNNLATVYEQNDHLEKALQYYLQALNIFKSLPSSGKECVSVQINISSIYYKMNQSTKGLHYLQKALKYALANHLQRELAILVNDLGSRYFKQKKYKLAIRYHQEAKDIFSKMKNKDMVLVCWRNIGAAYYALKDYTNAAKSFESCITILEQLRKTAPPKIRRDYLASQIPIYRGLISSYFRSKNLEKSYVATEKAKAALFTEKLQQKNHKFAIPSFSEIMAALDRDTAIISYANIGFDHIFAICFTKENVDFLEIPVKSFFAQHPLSQTTNRGTQKKRRSIIVQPKSHSQQHVINVDNEMAMYTKEYIELIDSGHPPQQLGHFFYKLLLGNLSKSISNKSNLIIVPEGISCFLPFETFVTPHNKYLVEKYHISYAFSLRIWNFLRTSASRNYTMPRKPLMAFGGAVYDTRPAKVAIKTTREVNELRAQLDLSDPASIYQAYQSLGILQTHISNISGTLSEVNSIAKIITNSVKITGKKVAASHVKKLSQQQQLSQYKILHFAVHGKAVPQIPELSSLILSISNDQQLHESFLHTEDISQLQLQADFVNLSACESGLGRLYEGEGIVGLTQSFVLAGANSVCSSLWPIDDHATSLFMKQLYHELNQGVTYDQALTNVKRKFIHGKYGQEYTSSYYWAPFTFYGKSAKFITKNKQDNTTEQTNNNTFVRYKQSLFTALFILCILALICWLMIKSKTKQQQRAMLRKQKRQNQLRKN